MCDADKFARDEIKKMSKQNKITKFNEMKQIVDYSKPNYGQNQYWAALFDALDLEIRSLQKAGLLNQ